MRRDLHGNTGGTDNSIYTVGLPLIGHLCDLTFKEMASFLYYSNTSNPATLGTCQSGMIREVASYQGGFVLQWTPSNWTCQSVLIRWVASFQGWICTTVDSL